MSAPEDERYIRRVLAGDTRAYDFLVDKYQAMAYTLSFRVLSQTQEAEEASQDAFVKAYRALASYQRDAAFSTWLYRIVYNTALSCLRKKKLTTITLDTQQYQTSTSGSGGMQALIHQDQQVVVEEALQKLAPEEATLISLYYIQEKNADEITTITGLTNANVRVKLFRARKKLHQYLMKRLKHGKEDLL